MEETEIFPLTAVTCSGFAPARSRGDSFKVSVSFGLRRCIFSLRHCFFSLCFITGWAPWQHTQHSVCPTYTQTHWVLRSSKRPKEPRIPHRILVGWKSWHLQDNGCIVFCPSLNTPRSVSTKHSLAWSCFYQCCCKMKKLCAQTSPNRLIFFQKLAEFISKWLISGLFLKLHYYWKTLCLGQTQIFSRSFCAVTVWFLWQCFFPQHLGGLLSSAAAGCARWMGLPSSSSRGSVTFSHSVWSRCSVFGLDGNPQFVHIFRDAICACCFALGHLFSSSESICSECWCSSLEEAVGLHLVLDQGWWKL